MRLDFVVERLAEPFGLWPVRQATSPGAYVTLDGTADDADIGSVMAQLAGYNQLLPFNAVAAGLDRLATERSLVLPGGLRATHGDRSITPSCCAGLEGWREWLYFLESGQSPWMGHSPDPWAEQDGGRVRLWSEVWPADSDPPSTVTALEAPLPEFERELRRAADGLVGFLNRVESWATALGGTERGAAVARAFDENFNVTRVYSS